MSLAPCPFVMLKMADLSINYYSLVFYAGAAVRIAQQAAAAHVGGLTDISGMAVGIDLGGKSSWGFDHPPNKNEMGRRLALQALHVVYALQTPLWTGPVFSGGAESHPGQVTIEFAEGTTAGGLALSPVKAKNIDGSSNDCTLCCKGALHGVSCALSPSRWLVPFCCPLSHVFLLLCCSACSFSLHCLNRCYCNTSKRRRDSV